VQAPSTLAQAFPQSEESAGFSSAEDAFIAVFVRSGIGQRGYQENREYASALYQSPDGTWHSTAIVIGSRFESSIPYHLVPASAQRIVGAHTHGQPHVPEDALRLYGLDFSQTDRRNAVHNFAITGGRIQGQLLLSSDLKVLRLSLQSDRTDDPSRVVGHIDVIGYLQTAPALATLASAMPAGVTVRP